MKTAGLIGGNTWRATAEYYRLINEGVEKRLGGHHSARLVLYSVDFQDIKDASFERKWDDARDVVVGAAKTLEGAGANFVMICANTMHLFAGDIKGELSVPFLHIADAVAERIKSEGVMKIALLGTIYTMEERFYRTHLLNGHDLAIIVPDTAGRSALNQVIYDELCHGEIREESRLKLNEIIEDLVSQGAEGVLLACTELQMLLMQEEISVPLFDTMQIHAEAAVDLMLEE